METLNIIRAREGQSRIRKVKALIIKDLLHEKVSRRGVIVYFLLSAIGLRCCSRHMNPNYSSAALMIQRLSHLRRSTPSCFL
jgi:hypothetical protein